MGQFGAVLILALVSGMLAQTLAAMEIRRIRRKDGVTVDGLLIRILDLIIIVLSSVLLQLCAWDAGTLTMTLHGLFGAFMAAAAWSDAKTGWVPDFAIVPATVLGALVAWTGYMGSPPGLMTGMWVTLGALSLFGFLVFAYLQFDWMRTTPPDAIFVLLILSTPWGMMPLWAVLTALILSILLVKTRPQWVRSLIPRDERQRLTNQMEEVLGVEAGHMDRNGWFPLGPIALFCVLVGHCANALM